jgi:SWI/SNF-related matrix-associated actin-dependent regulator of chromatin subfamily D
VKIEGRLLDDYDEDDDHYGGGGSGHSKGSSNAGQSGEGVSLSAAAAAPGRGKKRPRAATDASTRNGDATNGEDTDTDKQRTAAAATPAATAASGGTPARPTAATVGPPRRNRFSHFFKSITIEPRRNRSLETDGSSIIEWRKPPPPPPSSQHHQQQQQQQQQPYGPGSTAAAAAAGTASVPSTAAAAEFDTLCFERLSDEDVELTINLVKDETPERFWLSRELSAVLDRDEDDRAGVVMGIWEYVRARDLYDDDEHRRFRCDDKLRAVCFSLSPKIFFFSCL